MDLNDITPLLITFNEEANIERTLAGLVWARRIVVVDSGSTDRTLEILSNRPGATVLTRRFDSFAQQYQYGVDEGHIESTWVLALDADYVVTHAFVEGLRQLSDSSGANGYRAEFTYCVWGNALRGSLYPGRNVLFRRGRGRFVNDGHGHYIQVDGSVESLSERLHHDDRKSLSRWLASQHAYMCAEAEKLRQSTARLSIADQLRRAIILAPILVPIYALFVKGCILDGRPGWYYSIQRMIAESILSLELLEQLMNSKRV